ncbi:MAG: serine hydrolase [Ignavibacteriae bacterium]|nr:tetratricopeptide repeat protein [Ignavibacteriota bacterium]NOG99734.1 serine hydrolase [Ignavibacteriota bacterium]
MKLKIYFTIISLLVLIIACKAIDEKSNLDKESISQKTDELVEKYVALDIFSGAVLIAEDGKPFYKKAFGLADRENNIENTTKTKFDIGSMNKTFTKVVVYQLAEEGKLKLDDKLGNYLDGFPKESSEKITIENLLNHSSGYGDYHSPEYFNLPREKKNIAGLLPLIKKMKLHFEPGTDQDYSNAGYILLGGIIEKVSGKSYYQNVRERITEPLSLNETYLEKKDQVPVRAIGYFKTAKGEIEDNGNEVEIPNPDGGFQSTVSDILKFYREYYYGDKLLSAKIKSEMEEFSYYEEVSKTRGAVTQAGGFPGANTVIYEILRDKISIIVFANMDEPVAEQLGAGILALVRGEEPEEPALPAIQNIYAAIEEFGAKYVKNNFDKLTKNFHPSDPKDLILNQVGYEFLFDDEIDKAIIAFKLNVEMFPEVANCYDSLGEALFKKGNKKEALKNYKKALELNPHMPSAQRMVRELSGE